MRAIARLQLGKMRIMLGQGGRDADVYLETALAEFRALGERFGISFALTELADRIAMRGEFAAACEHYEQAIAVVTEVGSAEDVIRMRSQQAQLYWLLGDEAASAAAIAEAQRYAERVTWPDALAELALSKAELARWDGDAAGGAQATRRRGVPAGRRSEAGSNPRSDARPARLPRRGSRRGPGAPRGGLGGGGRGGTRADDRDGARRRRGPGTAPRRVRAGRATARGEHRRARAAGRLSPDVARIEQTARSRLGDARFAEAAREGTRVSWSQLAEVTLAS